MANFYLKPSEKEETKLEPKKSTVDFILNYSKALKVTEYEELQFETLLN
ncbi:hypothetical protein [Aquimarina brevivitae]|uniref:Uncharacterized protein n=1 Tax=Aquimarina brevivitae TaxID=323412 RepID=A0A4Q7P1B6_9FLAO|nr:hypothetical protein [Aquimarina brevivitae]RZS93623.1 hypothetical protein EV197_2203 [Aquimarina brevivitae]